MAESWNETEVDRVIDIYFLMLDLELSGVQYSKTEFRTSIMDEVDRSKGSIEFKLQNVSAVLAEIGAIFIDGYKPARNYQQMLRSRVVERFDDASDLRQKMLTAVGSPVDGSVPELGALSAVPDVAQGPDGRKQARQGQLGVDYQAAEARNRALGLAGEAAVVRRETRLLSEAGREDLARRVRHVSVEDGDGLGYDVLSFRPDGTERFLEVKTTRYSPHQPFLVSRNEVDFSDEEPERFALLRVYRFDSGRAGLYELAGSLRQSASLDAVMYTGRPRPASG